MNWDEVKESWPEYAGVITKCEQIILNLVEFVNEDTERLSDYRNHLRRVSKLAKGLLIEIGDDCISPYQKGDLLSWYPMDDQLRLGLDLSKISHAADSTLEDIKGNKNRKPGRSWKLELASQIFNAWLLEYDCFPPETNGEYESPFADIVHASLNQCGLDTKIDIQHTIKLLKARHKKKPLKPA